MPPMIMDIQLASPDDDPEPYIMDFIKSKENLEVQKVRVVGAPDTDDVFYVAYRTKSGTECRNLWLVKISIGGDMAQGQPKNSPATNLKKKGPSRSPHRIGLTNS